MAVLAVATHHVNALTGLNVPLLGTAGGLIGVQLFFLISGYLISHSAEQYPLREYFLHRLFRIFPAYWMAYLSIGALSGTLTAQSIAANPIDFFLNIICMQQLSAKSLYGFSVLHVSWTLTIEIFWYILAPFFARIPKKWTLHVLAICTAVSLLWIRLAHNGLFDSLFAPGFSSLANTGLSVQPLNLLKLMVIQNAFPAQLFFFALGWTLYRYRQQVVSALNARLLLFPLALFTLLLFLLVQQIPQNELALWPPAPSVLKAMTISVFLVISTFLLALKNPPLAEPLSVRIGKISYSIYLLHVPIFSLIFQQMAQSPPYWKIPLALIMVFVLSNIVYELIERPAMRLARRIAAR